MLVDPIVVSDEVTTLETPETQEEVQTPQIVEDKIPAKFRGKSLEEVIDIHLNLESELGRSRNEVGTTRRLVDELLNLRRSNVDKSTPEVKPVTSYDLAENPEETITQVAKRVSDERSAGAEQRLAALEQDAAVEKFEKRHPGFRSTLTTPEFAEWVQKSPLRVKFVQQAAAGDWDAGDELINLYKESGAATAVTATESKKTSGTEEAKKVALAKSGGSGANKVVDRTDSKKIYSRSELTTLYISNPREYDRLMDSGELPTAYAEKRVR